MNWPSAPNPTSSPRVHQARRPGHRDLSPKAGTGAPQGLSCRECTHRLVTSLDLDRPRASADGLTGPLRVTVSPGAAAGSVLRAITVTGETNAEVYRRYANELVHFATGLVGPDDAPDVVMDAALRAFSSPGWPRVAERRAYLYRCVLNNARSHHRSTLARRLREARAAVPLQTAPALPDPDVLSAVAGLSMRQRAVVVLTYWEDLSIPEVASTLGISQGSVHRHLARARARLREALA